MKKMDALALLVRNTILEALAQPDPELDGLPVDDAKYVVFTRMDKLINGELAKPELTAKWLLGWVRENPAIIEPFMEDILMEIHGDICRLIEDDIMAVVETNWKEQGRSNSPAKPQ